MYMHLLQYCLHINNNNNMILLMNLNGPFQSEIVNNRKLNFYVIKIIPGQCNIVFIVSIIIEYKFNDADYRFFYFN